MKTAATPLYDPLNSRNRLDINCGWVDDNQWILVCYLEI
jgi:hypothetical protein